MSTLKPIEPQSKQLEPYLEELRKKYKSEVYAADRYVEVFKIRQNLYAMYTPCTHAVGDNWLYLIDGPDRALYIDNGYGIGDLKGLGELLTGKEVICAVTHCHGDHAGGSPQWEEILCHAYCAEMLERQMENYDDWWRRFNKVGEAQHRRYYRDEDVIPFRPYIPVGLPDHSVINLGGDYEIELIHMGGPLGSAVSWIKRAGSCSAETPCLSRVSKGSV